MLPVRQSTAFEVAIGPVLDASGVAVTDCVVGDFKLKKTTGNFAALNGSATLTHVSAGVYDLVMTTSDTDTVGLSTVAIDDTVNGCAPLYLQVVEEAVYDMLFAASALGYIANAPVNVAQFGGSNGTFASGRPEVNATHFAGTAFASAVFPSNTIQISGDSVAADNAEAFFDGTGYAGTNNVIPTVTTLTGHTPQTGDSYAIVNSGTHGNAAIKGFVDDIGTAGAGLTAVPWNAAWDAEVQSEVQDAIEVNHLDHLLAVTYDPASKPGAADALLNELVESDAGVARYTANALEQAPAGGGGTSDWTADERTALRSILGIPAAGTTPDDPTTGILDTIRDSVGTRASQASVDDLPTNAELATALGTADDAVLAAIAALNNLSSAGAQSAAAAALTAYKALAADAAYNATTINGTLEVTFETP